MKMGFAASFAAIIALPALASAPMGSRCDFTATNADDEYSATNIRAGPSVSGKVVLTLEPDSPAVLHLVERRGEWFRIDRIDDAENDETMFRGTAWVHRSQLGLGVAGGDHRLYASPSRRSKAVMNLTPDGNVLDVMDCKDRWVKVLVDDTTTGWMADDAQCSSPLTTCN